MRKSSLCNVLLIVLLTSMSFISFSCFQTLAIENSQTTSVATSVHLVVNPNPVGLGQTFRVNITVDPPPPTLDNFFKEIKIYIMEPDGSSDVTTLSTELRIYPDFSYDSVWFERVPTQVGTWTLYADYTGDTYADGSIVYLPARSQTVKLTITNELNPQPTPAKKISVVSISAKTSANSNSMAITGSLTNPGAIGIPDGSVQLSYALSNDTSWTYIGSCLTDNQGKYSYQWTNSFSGTYTLKAEWFGNKDFLEASNTVMVNSIPYENEQTLVQSNSSIAQITYDPTVGLSFTVSGENGTAGFSKVTIPKSFMPEKDKIRVNLDGTPINYEIASSGDSWIITFTYQHSTHQVSINTAADTSENGNKILGIDYWMFITAIVVVIALAGAAGLIVWLAKTRNN